LFVFFFFFQAEDGIRDRNVTGVQTCALPILFIGPHAPATFQRKMKEAILAMVLTNRYSKSAILETYLNTIYYSDQAYGVEAAAETYFHTSAASLTLAQASLLAGLPRAPTAYNPILHPQAAHQRQLEVLPAIVKERY